MAIRYIFDGDEIVPQQTAAEGTGTVDFALSDLPANVLYTFEGDDPAGSLHSGPDEDYWQNQVPPQQLVFFQPLPYGPDPEELPAGLLRGQPDEDFWQNYVQPVQPSLYQPLPYQWLGNEEPAGKLFGQYDEDFWNSQVSPASLIFVSLSSWSYEQNEFVQTTPSLLFDEDVWSNGVPTLQPTFQQIPSWYFESDSPTFVSGYVDNGALFFSYTQDGFNVVYLISDDDIVPFVATVPEEDFWIQSDPTRISQPNVIPVPWTFAGDELGITQFDEDFYEVRMPPLPFLMTCPQPWSFDIQDIIRVTIAKFVHWIQEDDA